jgi:alkanesulfonate monooxygenase SsuD/methylene tetrahydromethanopterin reductase-like flavin-dependent oxidoreductase (luciferase family)
MMRLTAQFADSWNTCWLGHVSALDEPRALIEAACRDAGREPSTLDITVGVSVVYPHGRDENEPSIDPQKAITGTPEEVATAMHEYADAGVKHLICGLGPFTSESLAWFSEALRLYRQQLGGSVS